MILKTAKKCFTPLEYCKLGNSCMELIFEIFAILSQPQKQRQEKIIFTKDEQRKTSQLQKFYPRIFSKTKLQEQTSHKNHHIYNMEQFIDFDTFL